MKTHRAGDIRVSDHALVRFLERAGGLDVEALRASLEGSLQRASTAAAAIGTGDMVINADGVQYVVRDHVVVTVYGRPALSRVAEKP